MRRYASRRHRAAAMHRNALGIAAFREKYGKVRTPYTARRHGFEGRMSGIY